MTRGISFSMPSRLCVARQRDISLEQLTSVPGCWSRGALSMRSKRPRVVKLALAVEPEIRLWVTSFALTPTVPGIAQAQITQTRLSNNAAQVPKEFGWQQPGLREIQPNHRCFLLSTCLLTNLWLRNQIESEPGNACEIVGRTFSLLLSKQHDTARENPLSYTTRLVSIHLL